MAQRVQGTCRYCPQTFPSRADALRHETACVHRKRCPACKRGEHDRHERIVVGSQRGSGAFVCRCYTCRGVD